MYGLRVLELRSNSFYGNISCLQEDNYMWPSLRIINLASNNFNGALPGNLFRNMKAMMVVENHAHSNPYIFEFGFRSVDMVYYQDSVAVTFKGQHHHLDNILNIFTSIDFSNNHFEGVIPETVGELKSLYVLDLSHNALSGQMPSALGNLRTLESLELSSNNLSGEIPEQLVSLTSLSFLNLSYNDLVGRIPQGNQMNTVSESSFQGNRGLCGFPLNKTCSDVVVPEVLQIISEEQDSSGSNDVYIGAALGFVAGLGVIYVPLLFSKRGSKWYNKHVNKFDVLVLRRHDHRLEKEDW